jgi:predicted  nucleic acid-binding Zn-ribbon protein
MEETKEDIEKDIRKLEVQIQKAKEIKTVKEKREKLQDELDILEGRKKSPKEQENNLEDYIENLSKLVKKSKKRDFDEIHPWHHPYDYIIKRGEIPAHVSYII